MSLFWNSRKVHGHCLALRLVKTATWLAGDQSWQKNIIHVYMNYQFTFPPEPRPTMRGETGVTKNNSAKENHRR